jgi:hypothetical protein
LLQLLNPHGEQRRIADLKLEAVGEIALVT